MAAPHLEHAPNDHVDWPDRQAIVHGTTRSAIQFPPGPVLRSMRNDGCMAKWGDVGATVLTQPEVTIGQANEGSPAYDVAGRRKRLVKAHPDLR